MHDVVLDTIFGKLDFIPDVFQTRPRAENFLAFFFGICLCPMSTMNAFSEWFDGWKDQSSLNRFLTSGCWKVSELKEKYLGWLTGEVCTAKQTIYFIIDDSKSKKTGEFIEKAVMDYDTNEGRQVLCHTLVSSLVKMASFELPFELTLYDKTRKGKDRRVIFLFDAWYCAVKFISRLPKGVFWVSRLKRNGLVKIGLLAKPQGTPTLREGMGFQEDRSQWRLLLGLFDENRGQRARNGDSDSGQQPMPEGMGLLME
jgi:hypothetical protein